MCCHTVEGGHGDHRRGRSRDHRSREVTGTTEEGGHGTTEEGGHGDHIRGGSRGPQKRGVTGPQ